MASAHSRDAELSLSLAHVRGYEEVPSAGTHRDAQESARAPLWREGSRSAPAEPPAGAARVTLLALATLAVLTLLGAGALRQRLFAPGARAISSPSAAAPSLRALLGGVGCGIVADSTEWKPQQPAVATLLNIASADLCGAACLSNPQCELWSWGKARNVQFVTDQCWLMPLASGEVPPRMFNDKMISGSVPCQARPGSTTTGAPAAATPAAAAPAVLAVSAATSATAAPTGPMPASVGSGQLFCFSLVIPDSYEMALLATQFNSRASIFSCDTAAVYSSRPIQVAPGVIASVVDSDLHCDVGGEFRTALNLGIFEKVWQKVIVDGQWARHDWTIKVDPDAVFFPSALRPIIARHPPPPEGIYLNNCKYGLHGPLEVFSQKAVQTWAGGVTRCKDYFWGLCGGRDCGWGEDIFIDQCLQRVLGVKRDNEDALLLEDHCPPSPDHPFPAWNTGMCAPGKAAYHPFKNPADYQVCMNIAQR